jgi:hypothetical protein
MDKIHILPIEKVHNAYDAVRRGVVKNAQINEIRSILFKAYETEFFSDYEATLIENIEMELGHEHECRYQTTRSC